MPFPAIDLSRIREDQVRAAVAEGLQLREREIDNLHTQAARLKSELDTTRTAIDALQQKNAELAKQVRERDTKLAARDADVAALQQEGQRLARELEVARTAVTASQHSVEDAKKQIAQRDEELTLARSKIADLLNRLNTATPTRPKIAVDKLVNQFRTEIERINADVRAKPTAGAMVVDGCEVEIKGGLDITEGLHVTQLAEAVLGANTVSTLRFNLRPAAVVRIVDDE